MIALPESWLHAIDAVVQDPGIVVVLGASNSGKTTWVKAAAEECAQRGRIPLAIVDADIGQSTIGPPATVALAVLKEKPEPARDLALLPTDALFFIGAVSPRGHLLQHLVATKVLVDRAVRHGSAVVLVDTTGLIEQGAGFQLKLRKIDLLTPRHLIALQRNEELEPLLTVLGHRPGLTIHRLEISPSSRVRTAAERARYRAVRFAAYFANAKVLPLEANRLVILSSPIGHPLSRKDRPSSLLPPGMLRGEGFTRILVGLNNAANETLGIGVLHSVSEDMKEIRVLTPLEETSAVQILQVGSIRFNRLEEA
ncbi:MAG TPA: Clp1/GlmU family protein [Nitrospiraceae bacterium]|jgi:polynucleotide 5'-hydroxyl-kinase GRC3/NOL9|nr:Clp1/GlmU family protein [Nitrospiraceae bacterium]